MHFKVLRCNYSTLFGISSWIVICHVPWHHRTYHLTSAIFPHASALSHAPPQFFPPLQCFFFLLLLVSIHGTILITSEDLWLSGDAYIMFLLYPVPFCTLSDHSIIPLSIYILFPSPSCDLCVVYSLVPSLVCFFSLNINYSCSQHFCLLPLLFCPFRPLLHARNKDPVQSKGVTHKLKPCPYLLAPPTTSNHSSHLPPPPKPSKTSLPYSATSYSSRTSPTRRLHTLWLVMDTGIVTRYRSQVQVRRVRVWDTRFNLEVIPHLWPRGTGKYSWIGAGVISYTVLMCLHKKGNNELKEWTHGPT